MRSSGHSGGVHRISTRRRRIGDGCIKTPIITRSFVLSGRKTTVGMEPAFWLRCRIWLVKSLKNVATQTCRRHFEYTWSGTIATSPLTCPRMPHRQRGANSDITE
jgi:hypothetical protein